jgi:hypothetical protein
MEKIPKAETFIINKLEEKYPNENRPPSPKDVEEWLIEFAKMHVTEALKKASNKTPKHRDRKVLYEPFTLIEDILKSYPLDKFIL